MAMVGLFTGLNISATGLRAQRVRQNVIASNIANVETTRTPNGGPYKRQHVILEADPLEFDQFLVKEENKIRGTKTQPGHINIPQPEWPVSREHIGSGVKVQEIRPDEGPDKLVYNPDHPDADENGYVHMPNVNIVEEMVDMITATRAYEANTTAFNSTKAMLMKALDLAN
ncbi:MAG: flagellar basal body rod protein FlgC [Fibromonadaceae bacterium]|jgi:flagellar basal-body rod protein FlgC|nr:flagellar basal body rod protein FlgC [Fibromonadaceae bacterium]